MRQKLTRQMSIFSVTMHHDIGKELAAFSEILDATPQFASSIFKPTLSNPRLNSATSGFKYSCMFSSPCKRTGPHTRRAELFNSSLLTSVDSLSWR